MEPEGSLPCSQAAIDRAQIEKMLLVEIYNWFVGPYSFTEINRRILYSKYTNTT
jgi:hypothetical protein